ncbi:MAG: nuclear transport factor 2 family protein [Chloroflexota bacterium]
MKQSNELKELTLQAYKALTSGGYAFFERHFSQQEGVMAIASDPNEWWPGYATITQVFRAQIAEMSGITVAGADPRAYSEGTVGWVTDRFKVVIPGGPEIPFRLTCVFHQEEGDWKIVQWHASIGVPNEEAFGQKFTT